MKPSVRSIFLNTVIFLIPIQLIAQSVIDYSKLKGNNLKSENATGKNLADPFIERVTITEAGPRILKADVYFNHFNDGVLKIETLAKKKLSQKEIEQQTIVIYEKSGITELELHILPDLINGSVFESEKLKITYSPTLGKDFIFYFQLNKKWEALPPNENMVIIVKPEPFKTARKLLTANVSREGVVKATRGTAEQETSSPFIEARERTGRFIQPPSGDFSVNLKPEGPSLQPLSFYEEIKKDYNFKNPREISDIALDQIYRDKNEASGIYYYKPASYSLNWSLENGYKLKVFYGAGSSTGPGQVGISTSLNANINSNEYDFVKKMLRVYLNSRKQQLTDFLLLPAMHPKVNMDGNLFAFNIPSDKFSVNVSNSVYEPINISWSMTKDDAEVLISALIQNKNIGGEIVCKMNDTSSYAIPLNMLISDKSTFGRFELIPQQWRNALWQNPTPFSVKLNCIHIAMTTKVDQQQSPYVYTWKLNEVIVPSKSKVKFDASGVPLWIDNSERVLRMWIEYEVIPSEDFSQEAINNLIGISGISNGWQKSVKFYSLGVLDKYKVSFMKIKIRSKNMDPLGKKTVEKTITIDKDQSDIEAGPFYSWNEKDLNLEYTLSFITGDKTYEGQYWISTKDRQIYINKGVVEKLLGKNNVPKIK